MKKIFTILATIFAIATAMAQAENYEIGDIVTVKGVKGVVFQTFPQVKIVSVAETTAQWSTEKVATEATYTDNGKANMAEIKSISGWQSKYPAFKWCSDLGEGWYLPAQNELQAIYSQKDVINRTLSANGFGYLGSKDKYNYIWSSFDSPKDDGNYAITVLFSDEISGTGGWGLIGDKGAKLSVRAVFTLEGVRSAYASFRGYKIGDIVTVRGVKGVVFQTFPQVKIVSVEETTAKWCDYGVFLGATSTSNGRTNESKIKSTPGWQKKSPAFAWCADLGEGWYLPAKNELKAIYNQKDVINKTLLDNGFDKLGSKSKHNTIWSSSERSNSYSAYSIDFSSGWVNGFGSKKSRSSVRAVCVLAMEDDIGIISAFASTPVSLASYEIGDIVTVRGVKGVVFQTFPQVIKIVSVAETATEWSESLLTAGTTDRDNGKANMSVITSISDWQSKYPAFKWCADLGEGWYLPAKNELKAIYNQKDVINWALSANSFDELGSNDDNNWVYSSSVEGSYSMYFIDSDGRVGTTLPNNRLSVRAVFALEGAGKIVTSTPASKPTTPTVQKGQRTSAPYKVGDYYNENGKEGVVFEVSADGRHGKIVSMTQSTNELVWSSDSDEQERMIGTSSETDGAKNMAVVKSIPGWQDKYPAFKWCADLGAGWYLPAWVELMSICKNKSELNVYLTEKLDDPYWSSTDAFDGFAWFVYMGDGYTYFNFKDYGYYVRAVSAF